MISIVIPTFNVADRVKATIESVLEQNFNNYEIIIEDGNSTDNTIEVIDSLYKDERLKVFSEKDNGVYDAMNRAIKHVEGDYVLFLGAGDKLYNQNVLNIINDEANASNPDIIYGFVYGISNETVKPMNRKLDFYYTIKFFPVCHQAVVARTALFNEKKFDTKYKICADQDWLMYMKKNGKRIKYIDEAISIYPRDGLSSSREGERIGIREQSDIHKKYYPIRKLIHDMYYGVKSMMNK